MFLPQSSDKNLMVPVGGAIVAGSDQRIVQAVASSYPGRCNLLTRALMLYKLK